MTKKNKMYAFIIMILGILFTFVYFYLFFQKGIIFEDSFLKQSKIGQMYTYSGSAYGKSIEINLDGDMDNTGSATVTYQIGEEINRIYNVKASDSLEYYIKVTIYEEDKLLFEGSYGLSTSGFPILFDKNGELNMDDFRVIMNHESPFNANYQVSKHHIVSTAFQDNVIIRGRWDLFIVAAFLLIFIAIDKKWPLLFFHMRYALSVHNPEPSDLYITIQKASWVVVPTIAFAILVLSLLVH